MGKNFALGIFLVFLFIILVFSFFKSEFFFDKVRINLEKGVQASFKGICKIKGKVSGDITKHLVIRDIFLYRDYESMTKKTPVFKAKQVDLYFSLFDLINDDNSKFTMKIKNSLVRIARYKNGWNIVNIFHSDKKKSNLTSQFEFLDSEVIYTDFRKKNRNDIYFKNVNGKIDYIKGKFDIKLEGIDKFCDKTEIKYSQVSSKGQNLFNIKIDNGKLKQYGNYIFNIGKPEADFISGDFSLEIKIQKSFFKDQIDGKININSAQIFVNKLGEAKVDARISIENGINKIISGTVTYGRDNFNIKKGIFSPGNLEINYEGKNIFLSDVPFVMNSEIEKVDDISGKLIYKNNDLQISGDLKISKFTRKFIDFPGQLILSNINCSALMVNKYIDIKKLNFYFRYSILPIVFKFNLSGIIPKSSIFDSQLQGNFELLNTPLKFKIFSLNKKLYLISDNLESRSNLLNFEYSSDYLRHFADFKFEMSLREIINSINKGIYKKNNSELLRIISGNIDLDSKIEIRYKNNFYSSGYDFGKPEFSIFSKNLTLSSLNQSISNILIRVKSKKKSLVFLPGKFFIDGKKIEYSGTIKRILNEDKYEFHIKANDLDRNTIKKYFPQYLFLIEAGNKFYSYIDYEGNLIDGKVTVNLFFKKSLLNGMLKTSKIILKINQKNSFDFNIESIIVNGKKDAEFNFKIDLSNEIENAFNGKGHIHFKKKSKKLFSKYAIFSKINSIDSNFTLKNGKFLFKKANLGLNLNEIGSLTVETQGFFKFNKIKKYDFNLSGFADKKIGTLNLPLLDKKKVGILFNFSGNEKKVSGSGKISIKSHTNKVIAQSDFKLKKGNILFDNILYNKLNIPAILSLDFKNVMKYKLKLKNFELKKIFNIFPGFFPFEIRGKVNGEATYSFGKTSIKINGKNILIGKKHFKHLSIDTDIFIDRIVVKDFMAVNENSAITAKGIGKDLSVKFENFKFNDSLVIKSGNIVFGKILLLNKEVKIKSKNIIVEFNGKEYKLKDIDGKIIRNGSDLKLEGLKFILEGNTVIANGLIGYKGTMLSLKISKSEFNISKITKSSLFSGKIIISGNLRINGKYGEIEIKPEINWFTKGLRIKGIDKDIYFAGKLIGNSKGKFNISKGIFNLYGNKGVINGNFDIYNSKIANSDINIKSKNITFNSNMRKLFELFGVFLPVKKAKADFIFNVRFYKKHENILKGTINIKDLIFNGIVEKKNSISIPKGWNLSVKMNFAKNVKIENSRMYINLNGDLTLKGKNGLGWFLGEMKILKKSKFYYINNEFEIISGYYNFYNQEGHVAQDIFATDKKNLINNSIGEKKRKIKRNIEFKKINFDNNKKNLLDFNDNFLYIKSYTKVGRYIVYVEISKRMEKSESRFYSTPSLTQREIIALLLTGNDTLISSGRVSSDDIYNDDKVINIIGSDIQNQFLYRMSGKLRKKLKFDEFRVYSDLRDDSNLPSTTLSIGKYISPKTMLLFKKSFYEKNNEFLGLDYDLNKNIKLNSEIGTQADEVKFGIQFDKTFK